MLVALAVRGGNELMKYGEVYHLWNQTQILYDCYQVQKVLNKWLSKCGVQFCKKRSHDKVKNTIEDKDIPTSMRNELIFLAKCKGENKGLNPSMNEMEELMNEKIPALFSQIQN
jgi:hypothetical protein